ncbi:MAG: DUF3179 domain-containing protein [Chloroflexi bacterium]|nr:DUF3179 domain-containing protein [Chloroflexota bacterium]MCI0775140.1 DUF3179 domain-containing protein [Chloroflexota bacterium]MCI0834782.1 DUF3179 domain-containing protein [Chloroflexota bacterium]MCI0852378.1 DUF3179 domain-containing protein [Chloroflexota bacterium]
MHDRRIEGKVHIFGNEGVLFMSAMTWWDWETQSVWSQPWGAAIDGELTGTRLTLLPYDLVPWQTWLERHPETKVLVDERADLTYGGRFAIDRFVIGVSIGDAATGFYFASSAIEGVVNEWVGDFPVAVFADKDTRTIHVFLRTPRRGFNGPEILPDTLTFELIEPGDSTGPREVRDVETGSTWDIEVGVATGGPLRGTLLQRAPYVSAYYWAWEDFNPHTVLWGDRFDELK